MSSFAQVRLDALRSAPLGEESASALDRSTLQAYRALLHGLSTDERRACLARLTQGRTYQQIALDLGGVTPAEARGTVSRSIERVVSGLYGRGAHDSERLADLLGDDRTSRPARDGGVPIDMSPEEAAVIEELLLLTKAPFRRETWHKFTDLQEVGSGGFGTVYSAFDPALRTRVALKLYHPDRSQRPTEELLSEARKLARVRHPHVVVVHGATELDGEVGVWMDLVEGASLEDELRARLEQKRLFGAEEATEIGVALCQALEAVHAAGIVHGDIKAQNVVRGADGDVVLTDFGAARSRELDPEDANAARAGTPVYMAPELFQLHHGRLPEPTVASDVFAIGALLFYLVTGKFPVEGDSAADIKQAHETGKQMRLLAEERPDLPVAFAAVVEQALARTPQQRWLTAATMRSELEATRPDAEPVIKPKRLAQALGVTGGLVGLMLLLGFIATRAFAALLEIDREFSSGLGLYFRVGREAMVPLVVFTTIASVAVGVPLAGVWWLARVLGAPVDRVWERLTRPGRPKAAAAVVLLGALASWLLTMWAFGGLLSAVFSVEGGGPVEVAGLSSGRYSVYYGCTGLLTLIVGLLVWLWFPPLERQVSDAKTVRLMRWATLTVSLLSLTLATLPVRIVTEPFPVYASDDGEVLAVGQSDERLFLLIPSGRSWSSRPEGRDSDELVDTGRRRTLSELLAP